jgi:hypothetical protein
MNNEWVKDKDLSGHGLPSGSIQIFGYVRRGKQ